MFDLRVKNFRGFLNQEFKFRKVNILIGENSGGKSSVIKLLLALAQSIHTIENSKRNLTLSGRRADLGAFRDVIYNHSSRRRLEICFTVGVDYLNFLGEIGEHRDAPGSVGYLPVIRINPSEHRLREEREGHEQFVRTSEFAGSPVRIAFSFSKALSSHEDLVTIFSNEHIGTLTIETERMTTDPFRGPRKHSGGLCTLIFDSKRLRKRVVLREVAFRKVGFLTTVEAKSLVLATEKAKVRGHGAIASEIFYLLHTQSYIAGRLDSLKYVNPLLSKPAERVYVNGIDDSVTNLSNITELVDFLSSPTKRDFLTTLNHALKNFGIVDEIYLKKKDYTTELRVIRDGVDCNIRDVGYGVSLQIPIFAQALFGQTARFPQSMIIEQPEVHLHPRLQSAFIDALLPLTKSQPIFIETHSEHIIRMLQLIVKEGGHGLSTEDVSIHYFRKDNGRQKVTRHAINQETGRLQPPFPPGFYDVSYELALQLMN